jgi:hypothetical protein
MSCRLLPAGLLAAACLASASPADAAPYLAPAGKVMVGVAGGRTCDGYARAAGRRPAVFQFFVAWGDRFQYAYRRAGDARAGLMVHLSSYNGPGTVERATPREIALGREDHYLYALGRDFAEYGRPVYVRLFSEMNNAENPYSAYDAKGAPRGASHTHYWFRQAWRRAYLILNGGHAAHINRKLRGLGQPRLRDLKRPSHLRVTPLVRPRVSLQWVPMTAGSPNIAGNKPSAYWPGRRYVDWVGTDFYSRYPNFAGLSRFYHDKRYAGKPFVFGEWAMWGRDEPAFMRRFFAWVAAHPRVRMLTYNQGNTPLSAFRLYRYPRAARVMSRALRAKRYTSASPQPRSSAGDRASVL